MCRLPYGLLFFGTPIRSPTTLPAGPIPTPPVTYRNPQFDILHAPAFAVKPGPPPAAPPKAPVKPFNPVLVPEKALHVGVADSHPEFNVVLNKFTVVENHFLLTTKGGSLNVCETTFCRPRTSQTSCSSRACSTGRRWPASGRAWKVSIKPSASITVASNPGRRCRTGACLALEPNPGLLEPGR